MRCSHLGLVLRRLKWRGDPRRPRVHNIQVASTHPFAGELALVEYPAVLVRGMDLAARELRDGHQVLMQARHG